MPPGFICDCAKIGKQLKTVKNDDGLYVCARCGVVLPEDYDPEKNTSREDIELGSEMDFSRISYDPETAGTDSYTERLQKIKNRVDDGDEKWITKKQNAIKEETIKIAGNLGINNKLNEDLQLIVDQLIELRFQDYEGYDLIPPLAVCTLLRRYEDRIRVGADIGNVATLVKEFDDTVLAKYLKLAMKRVK